MSRLAQFSALRREFSDSLGAEQPGEGAKTLPLLGDRVLPDGGLPRGAVVEIASAHGLARATSLALSACSAAQHEARLRSGDAHTVGAWCAFIDPWSTLNAPALATNGVDASRLLVVRPPLDSVARIAVRIAESRAFSLVAIDTVGVPGAALAASHMIDSVKLERWPTVVRRLAIAVERSDTTIVLLTDTTAPRALPLPVSMRLELSLADDQLHVRVAKERHGRVTPPIAIAS